MSSETSSEIKSIKYLDKNGNQLDTKTEIKRQTTDTDYHFGLIANQDKLFTLKSESSSDLNNVVNSSDVRRSSTSSISKKSHASSKKSISSSKSRINNVNLNSPNTNKKPPNSSFVPPNSSFVPPNSSFVPPNSSFVPPNSSFIPNVAPTTIPSVQLSAQELRMKKIELLRRLSEIKAKGYALTKEYDFNSTIEEMEYEYGLLKSFADKRNGVKIYKNILLNGISLVEFFNDKYDPFDFKLKGWSEHMAVEVDSYEDIFEELYEKYKGSGTGMPPEVKLVLLILASGGAFHFSRTQLGGMPGVSSVATGMINKMMAPKKTNSQFATPQEINLEKQKQMLREKEKEMKQQKVNNNHSSMSRDAPDIRAPENVQDILSRIKHIQQNNNLNNTSDTQEESAVNDRLVSDSTLSENKKRGRKPKKSLITINT